MGVIMGVMRHQPTHDWIVAKKIHQPERETMPIIHGVVRVTEQSPPHHYAEVIAVGPGRAHPQTGYTPPLPCRPGDIVMIRAVAGDPETIEGDEYHWLIPDEVLAIVPRPLPIAVLP